MAKELVLDIIDGTFDSTETRDLLIRLLYNEIQFHCNEKFSKQVRLGVEDDSHDIKCDELSDMIQHVKKLSDYAEMAKSKVMIKGVIEVRICD